MSAAGDRRRRGARRGAELEACDRLSLSEVARCSALRARVKRDALAAAGAGREEPAERLAFMVMQLRQAAIRRAHRLEDGEAPDVTAAELVEDLRADARRLAAQLGIDAEPLLAEAEGIPPERPHAGGRR